MINIGTISHGTLRTQDLLISFSDTYWQYCRDDRDYNDSLYLGAKDYAGLLDRDSVTEEIRDTADGYLESLIEALEEVAARHNCYFGTTEGDGSDFGFWPNEGGEA